MKNPLCFLVIIFLLGMFSCASDQAHWKEWKDKPLLLQKNCSYRVFSTDYERSIPRKINLWVDADSSIEYHIHPGADTVTYTGGYPLLRFALAGEARGIFLVDIGENKSGRQKAYAWVNHMREKRKSCCQGIKPQPEFIFYPIRRHPDYIKYLDKNAQKEAEREKKQNEREARHKKSQAAEAEAAKDYFSK